MADDTHKNGRYYRHLSRNMVLIIVLVSFTPLILTGIVLITHFTRAYHDKVFEHLGELVQKHSQNIDSFLTDRLANIRVLARSYTIDNLYNNQFLSQKLRLLNEEYRGVYVDLGLVDEEGIQVAYAGPFNLLGADYGGSEWYTATRGSEHYISNVFTGLRGSPHFIVAVKQRWQDRDWVLRATINFEAFNSLVENIRVGETGFIFILNRLGEFQTRPRSEVSLNNLPFKQFMTGETRKRGVSFAEYTDDRGKESVLAMTMLKNGEWLLCGQQESSDAFAVIRRTKYVALMVFVAGALLIVIVAELLSKRIVKKIAEADQDKAVMNEKVIEAGRLASIGELAAGIAHEINNPVAIMVEEAGWIEDIMAENELENPENLSEMRRSAHQIQVQGARCKEITHKLLSFARKTDPRITEVDVNEIVEDTISLLKQKTRYANVKINADLDRDLPFIAASPSEMQQVLLNLVNNAVDAIGDSGGVVTLKTFQEEESVVLIVEDTGQGIPEPVIVKIFDPFFTTKPVGQGTGLGLSICFGIVDKLGGTIAVRSQVGVGTAFTIRLPKTVKSPDLKNKRGTREAAPGHA